MEYPASLRVSAPLVSKIEAQSHETPEEAEVQRLVNANRNEKDDGLKGELEEVKAMLAMSAHPPGSYALNLQQNGLEL